MKKLRLRGFIFIFFVILFLFNARVSFANNDWWLLFETEKIQGNTVITDLEKGRFDQGWMISKYRYNEYIDYPLENRFRLENNNYYTASFKDPLYTQMTQSARFKYDLNYGYIFGASISQNINLPDGATIINPSSSTMKISSIKIPVHDNGIITVSAEVAMNNLLDPNFWEPYFNENRPNKVNLVVWFLGNDGSVKGHDIKSVNIEKANEWYKLESSFMHNARPSGTRYVAIDIWPSALGPYEGPWWFGYYNLYVKDIKVAATQYPFGTVSINIEYRDVNGKLLQSETKSGQTGKEYTTEPPEELKVGGDTYVWNGKYPPNAIGLCGWSSEKVVYYYEKSEGPDLSVNISGMEIPLGSQITDFDIRNSIKVSVDGKNEIDYKIESFNTNIRTDYMSSGLTFAKISAVVDSKTITKDIEIPTQIVWGNSISLLQEKTNKNTIALSLLEKSSGKYKLVATYGNNDSRNETINPGGAVDKSWYNIDYYKNNDNGQINLNKENINIVTGKSDMKMSDAINKINNDPYAQDLSVGDVISIQISDSKKEFLYQSNKEVLKASSLPKGNIVYYEITENGFKPLYINQIGAKENIILSERMNCASFKEKYEKDFKETFEYVPGIDYTGIHYILDSITCDPKMTSKPKNEVFFNIFNITASSDKYMVSFENNPSFKFSKEAIPEYQDIWTLNNDPYKEAIRKLRLENISEENPVLSFEQPISSKYNFVMRQTDYIKVAIPEIQNISIINQNYTNPTNQNLLDIVFTPSENVNSIDFYIFNVGQIVEDYQYKDVHAKVTLKVGSGWNYNNNRKSDIHLTFYDFTDISANNIDPKPKYFLRLLRSYYGDTPTFQTPITIEYKFYTNKPSSSISWEDLDSEKISLKGINDESRKEFLKDKDPFTYYKYNNKNLNQIDSKLTEVEVDGYWLFTDIHNSISFELLPEEPKFAQLYANKRSTDTSIPKVLFSSYSLLEEDPILKIQGTSSKSNLNDKNMQLLMTYEGNKFGYTYQGVGKGEHTTVSVSYSSDIPNKISFSAPKWIKTDYQEVTADDWNHLSYSFIQNIPFYSDNDISNMKWIIPDPILNEGPFELGEWMIYNENNINVTNRFNVTYEENQTVISTKKDIIDNEFYNHDYKFTRKLKLKENNSEFSPNSKKDGRYYIQSPDASIIFLTTYSNSISNTINSDNKSKIDIFNMNIVSKINVECYFDDTLIDQNRCRVDSNKTFLLDQVTQEHIPELLIEGKQRYKFKESKPEIPFYIKATNQALYLNYEMLRISISVPRELKFKTVKIPLPRKKKEIISERENNDWQIEVFISEGIPEDRHCLVSVTQDSPFRYQHEAVKSELKSARLMYKSEGTSNMEEYLNVGEGVCINDNDFSLNNGNYKTTWTQKSGLLFNYRETLIRPFYVKPYTSNLTFTLNYTL